MIRYDVLRERGINGGNSKSAIFSPPFYTNEHCFSICKLVVPIIPRYSVNQELFLINNSDYVKMGC
jgi:hypothetical protein